MVFGWKYFVNLGVHSRNVDSPQEYRNDQKSSSKLDHWKYMPTAQVCLIYKGPIDMVQVSV